METIKRYNKKKIITRGALLMAIVLLLSVFAIQTKALDWPQTLHDPEKKGIGSSVKPCLESPEHYKESDIIVNESGEGGYVGTQFFELSDEFLLTQDNVLEFRLKDSACNSLTEVPEGIINNIAIYDDLSLDDSHKVPIEFQVTIGKYTVRPKNSWFQLSLPAGSLDGGKEYYIVFKPTMYATDPSKTLQYYHVYKFITQTPSAGGYNWQGESVQLLWADPSADYITTETPSAQTDESGVKYYFNECSKIICPGKDQTFSFDVKGGGANHIGKEGNEPPANHIFVYADKSLSEDSLIASAANGKITDVQVGDPKVSDGMKNVSFTIPKDTMEDGKDYYLVTDENLETNKQNGTPRVVGAKIITKITAKHDDIKPVPSTQATCTEPGWADQMKCETCGTITDEGRELPPRGHFASIPEGYKASTCTEKGWMPEQKCDRCGILMSEAHETDPLGHAPNVIEGKEPTCTETGLTEGQVCARCKEVIVPQETIPALGHDFKDGKCTRCDAVDPDYKPTEPELVSSEGNDLIAKTYTDLELQNAPGDGYLYKFIVFNETTNQWYKLQDFSDATTFRWYTGPAGVKNLYVDIKNKADETDVTRVALTGVNVADNSAKVTLTSEKGNVLDAKTKTTLTASVVEGGESPFTYKFIVHNNDTDEWYRLQDFGESNVCEWYTANAASKTLYVDVKDANGNVVREPLNVTVQ